MSVKENNIVMVYDALRESVGEWYENAYGEKESYKNMIEFYATGTEHRVNNLLGILKERLDLVNPKNVLDVGCGFASIPVYLAWNWKSSKFIVTDRYDNYYLSGKSAAEKLALDNISFKTEEISSLSDSNKYDLVISCNMLNFMTSHDMLKDALERLATAVKDDGYLVIHTPHFWSYYEPFTKLPFIHFLPRKLQDFIVKKLNKRSGLLDVRDPSLNEITTVLLKMGMNRIDVTPNNFKDRIWSTHITTRFQKK